MPVGAPLPKVAATKGYGAQVELAGNTVDEALVAAHEFAERTGAVLIHPFDHPDVIAGQGTVGAGDPRAVPGRADDRHRGRRRRPDLRASRWRSRRCDPDVRVIGVQAAGAAAFPPSLRGRASRSGCRRSRTIADGIAVGRPGDLTFAHVSKLVDEVVTVTDEDISRALLMLLERGKLVVEPAGAVGVAALLAGAVRGRDAGGGGALRRQHRPAADAAGDRARPGRGRPLPAVHRALRATGPGSWPRCSAQIAEHRAQRGGRGAPAARTRACGSARWRWRCRWRPAGVRALRPADQRAAGQRLPGRLRGRAVTPVGHASVPRRSPSEQPSARSAGERLEADHGHLDVGAAGRGVGARSARRRAPRIALPERRLGAVDGEVGGRRRSPGSRAGRSRCRRRRRRSRSSRPCRARPRPPSAPRRPGRCAAAPAGSGCGPPACPAPRGRRGSRRSPAGRPLRAGR